MNKETATSELTGIIGYPKEVLDEFELLLYKKKVKAQELLIFYLEVTVNENSTNSTSHSFEVNENASDSTQKDSNSLLAERQEELIGKINLALTRIRLGTYGIDKETKQLIPKERLRAQPLATMCIETKNMAKKQEKIAHIQKVKGGVSSFESI